MWLFYILLGFAIWANNFNITMIGMIAFCLGIFSLTSKSGKRMCLIGGIVAAISYFVFQIPLH